MATKNGTKLRADGRSAPARRQKHIFLQLAASFGGLAKMRPGEVQIARRAASLCVLAETAEAQIASGTVINVDEYIRTSGLLRRLLDDLGQLDRPAPANSDDDDDDGDLESYLASLARQPKPKPNKCNRPELRK